jgi:hypothetical protein
VQNVDLSLDLFFHSQLLNLGLVEDLDRYFVSCDGMSGEFDLYK